MHWVNILLVNFVVLCLKNVDDKMMPIVWTIVVFIQNVIEYRIVLWILIQLTNNLLWRYELSTSYAHYLIF